MRLIDADQFITEMEINIGNIYNPDIIKGMRFGIELINSRPTSFNKEMVIDEMKKTGVRFCVNVKCPEDCQNCEHGVLMKALIDIVGKGGIE